MRNYLELAWYVEDDFLSVVAVVLLSRRLDVEVGEDWYQVSKTS